MLGLPWRLSHKETACQCRRCRLDPWAGKIPWRRKWQPAPVFLPEKSHEQRSLVGYSPWGHEESEVTQHVHRALAPQRAKAPRNLQRISADRQVQRGPQAQTRRREPPVSGRGEPAATFPHGFRGTPPCRHLHPDLAASGARR